MGGFPFSKNSFLFQNNIFFFVSGLPWFSLKPPTMDMLCHTLKKIFIIGTSGEKRLQKEDINSCSTTAFVKLKSFPGTKIMQLQNY